MLEMLEDQVLKEEATGVLSACLAVNQLEGKERRQQKHRTNWKGAKKTWAVQQVPKGERKGIKVKADASSYMYSQCSRRGPSRLAWALYRYLCSWGLALTALGDTSSGERCCVPATGEGLFGGLLQGAGACAALYRPFLQGRQGILWRYWYWC